MAGTEPLAPGATLGLLGGGQLGRMFARAASRLGYRVLVLERGPCPAGEVSAGQIDADYRDPAAIARLRAEVSAVTTEFENVPAPTLAALAAPPGGLLTTPAPGPVAISQDRRAEKRFLASCPGVEVAPWAEVADGADLERVPDGLFPGLLKTASLGYDGKGQRSVTTRSGLARAWEELGRAPCVLEQLLPLDREVSVITARGLDGRGATFPVFQNRHRDGILAETILPAVIPAATADLIRRLTALIADRLDYRGVLCVEYFILADGRPVANEMAPRPHNSGHATIEACRTSQFEQQVRVMCGLPLGDPGLIRPAVMLNLLGDLWREGEPDWPSLLAIPDARLHLYGKKEARPGRKMGHLTCLGDSPEEALTRARRAAAILGLPSPATP